MLAAVVDGAPTGYLRPLGLDPIKQAELQLGLLHRPGTLIELRAKTAGGMVQDWHTHWRDAASEAVRIREHTDVYVGVLPRLARDGGKRSVASAPVLWVECDKPSSVEKAIQMSVPPNMVICSSPGKAHCYWILRDELTPEHIEIGNKRLAYHLGADMKATDAARILRVAGTYNHKYAEPKAAFLAAFGGQPCWSKNLVAGLDDPKPPPTAVYRPQRPKLEDPTKAALRAVSATEYAPALAGREMSRGMMCCPWHKGGQERTPSLHVTGPADTLFYCFGCGEGGDIFRFAAKCWGMDETRDFHAIVERLSREFR